MINTLEDLFAKTKTDPKFPGCKIWTGALHGPKTHKYGRTYFRGKDDSSHRVSYLLTVGEIPDGAEICHTCDNPPCCNPDHVFLGDAQANATDKVNKGRQSKGTKHSTSLKGKLATGDSHWTRLRPGEQRGVGNGRHKLVDSDIPKIRSYRDQGMIYKDIGAIFGITAAAARFAYIGHTWKHLG